MASRSSCRGSSSIGRASSFAWRRLCGSNPTISTRGSFYETREKMNLKKFAKQNLGILLPVVAVVMAFMILTGSVLAYVAWAPVSEGKVEVVKEWGDATGEVNRPGGNWITPVKQSTTSLSTRQQAYTMSSKAQEGAKNYADPVSVKTEDGVKVDFNVVVRYHLEGDKDDAVDVYTDYKTLGNAEKKMIRPTVKRQFITSAGSMKTSDVYTTEGQRELTEVTREALKDEFNKTGLVLDSVQITGYDMPQSYEKAVTQKEVAYQNELKAEAQVKVAEQEARAAVKRAEGEAKSNEIVAESVENNPELIQIRFIEAIEDSEGKTIYLPSDKTPTLTKDTED